MKNKILSGLAGLALLLGGCNGNIEPPQPSWMQNRAAVSDLYTDSNGEPGFAGGFENGSGNVSPEPERKPEPRRIMIHKGTWTPFDHNYSGNSLKQIIYLGPSSADTFALYQTIPKEGMMARTAMAVNYFNDQDVRIDGCTFKPISVGNDFLELEVERCEGLWQYGRMWK